MLFLFVILIVYIRQRRKNHKQKCKNITYTEHGHHPLYVLEGI